MQQNYEKLIELIYEIPLQKDGWSIFAKYLRKKLDVTAVCIAALDLERQAISFSQFESIFSVENMLSTEIIHLHLPIGEDPRWAGFFDSGRQGWYKSQDYLDDQFIQQSEFYKKFLLPQQVYYTAVHELIWDDQLCVFIAIYNSYERAALSDTELEFLDQLLIHLRRIANIQRRIFKFSEHSIVSYDLVDRLSQPIILMYLNGDIAHKNSAASEIIKNSNLLNMEQGKLVLPKKYQTEFNDKIKNLEYLYKQQHSAQEHKIDDFCIKLQDEKGDYLYIFASLLASEREIRALGVRPHVMLNIYYTSYNIFIDFDTLRKLFGITPAEYKVALLLLEGYAPKEIANKHAVNSDTIRKQLQSIYKKTSTNRQSDLVKLLLNMPCYK